MVKLGANLFEMEVIIRKANLNDAKALAELGAKTFYDTYHKENTTEDMRDYITKYFTINVLQTELQDKNTMFFVAETNQELIGYIKLYRTGNSYIPNVKAMEVSRFYVDKQFQGHKLGAKLMLEAEKYAMECGCEVMWLGVWQKNITSIIIYEKLGYNKVGTTTFTLGNDIQDDYIMVKHL
mgnify:FL=1